MSFDDGIDDGEQFSHAGGNGGFEGTIRRRFRWHGRPHPRLVRMSMIFFGKNFLRNLKTVIARNKVTMQASKKYMKQGCATFCLASVKVGLNLVDISPLKVKLF